MKKCVLRDFWDLERKIDWEFKSVPSVGDTFTKDDVTYKIERVAHFKNKNLVAVAKMTKYKIANTSTQFVHKCPAKRDATERMTRDDVVKMEAKHGKHKAAQIMNERVKIRAMGAQIKFKCPYCKTEFFKDRHALPNTVEVAGTMNKKKLRKKG